MTKKIVIAGGTGFVGHILVTVLCERGYDVFILSRAPGTEVANYTQWDGKTVDEWASLLNGAEAVVNLAGRSINCRHTPENRRQIVESRVDSVRTLGSAIATCRIPPKAFVQAAGIGIYGNAGDSICDENAPHGNDFVAAVSEQWEAAFDELKIPGTRKVLLRLGVVLGRGGFLKMLGRLAWGFLGGQVGNGRQFISWIHGVDLARMFIWAIERPDVAGTFNATAPVPITNAGFMGELRRALHRPWSPPVPEFAARMGSWLLGTEADLALTSTRAIPRHFLDCGFNFEFPEIRSALDNIYKKP